MAKTITQEFTKGLWEEIPPFRLVLGLVPGSGCHHDHGKRHRDGAGHHICPGMFQYSGVHSPKYHSGKSPNRLFYHHHCILCVVVELLMQAYAYPLFLKLGVFIPLIVVNCIVLGRAEAFASKNKISPSQLPTVWVSASGLPFLWGPSALYGSYSGKDRDRLDDTTCCYRHSCSIWPSFQPFDFMVQAPGAFVCLGLMLCVMNLVGKQIGENQWATLNLLSACIFVNNILLAQFLGNCPFLGTSKKMETAVGMAMAVIFVLVLAGVITWVSTHFFWYRINWYT